MGQRGDCRPMLAEDDLGQFAARSRAAVSPLGPARRVPLPAAEVGEGERGRTVQAPRRLPALSYPVLRGGEREWGVGVDAGWIVRRRRAPSCRNRRSARGLPRRPRLCLLTLSLTMFRLGVVAAAQAAPPSPECCVQPPSIKPALLARKLVPRGLPVHAVVA